MSSGGTRGSRRRRVLSDESRFGSTLGIVAVGDDRHASAEEPPRYGEQAHIENHPQVSDFAPRRKRVVLAATTGLLGLAAGAEALLQIDPATPTGIPGVAASELHAVGSGLIAWASTVTGIAAFLYCRLIYSLRRHRVDDHRGSYRIWRWASAACLLWPITAATNLHRSAAQAAAAVTGWSATAESVEWWLTPGLLLGAWIAYRLYFELKESPGSAALLSMAFFCYAASAIGASGVLPGGWARWTAATTRTLPLVGHAFALASLAGFARYVVLDVQGLIQHVRQEKRRRRSKPKSAKSEPMSVALTSTAASQLSSDARRSSAVEKASTTGSRSTGPDNARDDETLDEDRWVGGPEDEGEGDDPQQSTRRLSKAERKRLRKQQRQDRRAA